MAVPPLYGTVELNVDDFDKPLDSTFFFGGRVLIDQYRSPGWEPYEIELWWGTTVIDRVAPYKVADGEWHYRDLKFTPTTVGDYELVARAKCKYVGVIP